MNGLSRQMIGLKQGIYLGVWLGIVGSFLGYISRLHPFLELATHFKVQYFGLGLVGFFWFLYQGRGRWIGLSLLCVVLNLVAIVPWYLPIEKPFSESVRTLRVLSVNVNVKNENYAPTLSLIRAEAPDLVTLIEVNQGWLKALETLQTLYPYSIRSADAKYFGIVTLSKFPIQVEALPKTTLKRNSYLIGNLKIDGEKIQIIALHPPPAKSLKLIQQRNQILEQMSNYIQSTHSFSPSVNQFATQSSVIVIGDLNTTMWSPTYQQFIATAKLKNTRQGFGILPTWHAFIPPILIPIDHCLVSQKFWVTHMQTGPNVNSDHLPIMIELRY